MTYKPRRNSTIIGNFVTHLLFLGIVIFTIFFGVRLMNILGDRTSLKYVSNPGVDLSAIDSLQADSITRQILLDTRVALEGYRAMEQSFSILQSATGIIEVAMGFIALGIPLFLFMLYFVVGKDLTQLRDIRDEVFEIKEDIIDDTRVIQKERETASKGVISSFRDYNPVYAQLDTRSIRANLLSSKKVEDFTDEDYFLLGGTYYIDQDYENAATAYMDAKKIRNESLYDFYLGITYDDHFSSQKFENGDKLDEELIALANLALDHYEKAAKSSKDNDKKSLAISNLAFTHLELGKPNTGLSVHSQLLEAEIQFQKAEKFNPDDPFIHFGKAITAHFLEKKEEAIQYFQHAERLEYTEKGKQYEKMYSRLQFRFMREEIYDLFKSPNKKHKTT